MAFYAFRRMPNVLRMDFSPPKLSGIARNFDFKCRGLLWDFEWRICAFFQPSVFRIRIIIKTQKCYKSACPMLLILRGRPIHLCHFSKHLFYWPLPFITMFHTIRTNVHWFRFRALSFSPYISPYILFNNHVTFLSAEFLQLYQTL